MNVYPLTSDQQRELATLAVGVPVSFGLIQTSDGNFVISM